MTEMNSVDNRFVSSGFGGEIKRYALSVLQRLFLKILLASVLGQNE